MFQVINYMFHHYSEQLYFHKQNGRKIVHLEHKFLHSVTKNVEGPGRSCVIDLNFVWSYQFHQRREQFVSHVSIESIHQPIKRNCFSEMYTLRVVSLLDSRTREICLNNTSFLSLRNIVPGTCYNSKL